MVSQGARVVSQGVRSDVAKAPAGSHSRQLPPLLYPLTFVAVFFFFHAWEQRLRLALDPRTAPLERAATDALEVVTVT